MTVFKMTHTYDDIMKYRPYGSNKKFFYLRHIASNTIVRIAYSTNFDLNFHADYNNNGNWVNYKVPEIRAIAHHWKLKVIQYHKINNHNCNTMYYSVFKIRMMHHSIFGNFISKYRIRQISNETFHIERQTNFFGIPLHWVVVQDSYLVMEGFEDGTWYYFNYNFISKEDCYEYIKRVQRPLIKFSSFKSKIVK